MLSLMIGFFKTHFPEVPVIVATTSSDGDDEIQEICEVQDVRCHRGSESNVLKRIADAAKMYGVDDVTRVCADNPFLQKKFISELITGETGTDHYSYAVNGKPTILTHYGFFVERVKRSALEKALSQTSDPFYLEHVTNYIYQHPEKFEVELLEVGDELNKLKESRFTVDDESDFLRAKKILSTFGRSPDLNDLAEYLSAHPEEQDNMKKTIEKYQK